jgi:hypothetical protein
MSKLVPRLGSIILKQLEENEMKTTFWARIGVHRHIIEFFCLLSQLEPSHMQVFAQIISEKFLIHEHCHDEIYLFSKQNKSCTYSYGIPKAE